MYRNLHVQDLYNTVSVFIKRNQTRQTGTGIQSLRIVHPFRHGVVLIIDPGPVIGTQIYSVKLIARKNNPAEGLTQEFAAERIGPGMASVGSIAHRSGTEGIGHPDTLELSESTLYPVLRRLQKDQLLTVYDAPFNGRNRRYYQITSAGREQLAAYAQEWSRYRSSIDTFFREVE